MTNQRRGEWTSASNALADRLCRGRHQAQIGLPELPRTNESDSGTVIHALWTGTEPHREPIGEEIDKAEALREQEALVAEQFFNPGDELVRLVERRLWHEFPSLSDDPGGGKLRTSGQGDVVLLHTESRRALICDGKSGWLAVTPNSFNLQLRRLAVLLWLQIDPIEIGVCILKPLAKTQFPCTYTVRDLEQSLCEMEEDVRQNHDSSASRTAGEEQCRYCRARESCPTRLGWLSSALPTVFPPLPLVSARDWTPAQRAHFLEREKAAREWLEFRKDEIKALLKEIPESVPGYALKPGRNLETITDCQEVYNRFCNDLGGTLDAFMKCIKVGKTALKDQLRALSRHKGKALEADMDALLAGCVECRTSEPTIEGLK